MELAARIGLSRSEWEAMTPRELTVWARAFQDRMETERRGQQIQIYNLAALIRGMIWGKNPPRLEQVFPDAVPRRQAMSADEMYSQARALNAMFGGKEA